MRNGIPNRKTCAPTPDRLIVNFSDAIEKNLNSCLFFQRRLSEPSGGMPISNRCQRPNTSHQMNGTNNMSRSENEGLDKCNNTWNEIEAGDVRDGKWILRFPLNHY